MPTPSDSALDALLHHPVVEPHLRELLGDRTPLAHVEFLDILSDLERYGEVCLFARPSRTGERAGERYMCELLGSSWTSERLRGTGHSPLVAALRCLMEVLHEGARQAHRAAEHFTH